jgi:hypothetical protein
MEALRGAAVVTASAATSYAPVTLLLLVLPALGHWTMMMPCLWEA